MYMKHTRNPFFGTLLLGSMFCMGACPVLAYTNPQTTDPGFKQDMKDAGHNTKNAAKDTGHGIKSGTKKSWHATKRTTKKATHKVAHKTDEGARKVEHKTSPQQ
jgi:hypothetical protein